jgi:hypothetical protein
MLEICLQILSSKHQTYFEFSLGAAKQTPIDGNQGDFRNKEHNNLASEGPCDSQKHSDYETGYSRLKSESERTGPRLINKSKKKRQKRQEKNRNKVKQKSLKVYGINSAGLSSKLE